MGLCESPNPPSALPERLDILHADYAPYPLMPVITNAHGDPATCSLISPIPPAPTAKLNERSHPPRASLE